MSSIHPQFLKLCERAQERTLVMGVLNVTPDSFSDGGLYLDPKAALARAKAMMAEGADLIDLGGESTRPGAAPVDAGEELKRILPLAEILRKELPETPWSIDTVKATVAEKALELGACLINDISALTQDPAMAPLAAKSGCGVVLMHRAQAPKDAAWSTQEKAAYGEEGVVLAVRKFLTGRASSLMFEGLNKKQFWIDPGFGFGKSVEDNLKLLASVNEFVETGYPVMLGTSRKSSLGAVLGGLPEAERLEATAATTALAAWAGVACVRVHDVKEMTRVVKTVQAVRAARPKPKETARPIHPFRNED